MVVGYSRSESGNQDFAVARYDAAVGPDFSIALEPQQVRVARGKKATVRVNVDRLDGFAGIITLSVPDASALGIRLNHDSVLIDGSKTKFKLKVRDSAPTGNHSLFFIGTDSSGRQRKATLSIQIE